MDEIEWGEWGPMEHQYSMSDDVQFQRVGGVAQWRYPVPNLPVVETVSVNGGHQGPFGWGFQQGVAGQDITHRITLTIIDGVVQPTATVEAL